MPDTGRTFTVERAPNCEQLYMSQIRRLARYDVTVEDMDVVWDEIAGLHAAGRKPKRVRKLRTPDPEGRPQYGVMIHGIRFRYAVDEPRARIIINRVDPPSEL